MSPLIVSLFAIPSSNLYQNFQEETKEIKASINNEHLKNLFQTRHKNGLNILLSIYQLSKDRPFNDLIKGLQKKCNIDIVGGYFFIEGDKYPHNFDDKTKKIKLGNIIKIVITYKIN